METSKRRSFFQDLKMRELNGFRVRKRPYINGVSSEFIQLGAVSIEHDGDATPPLATSFCQTSINSHILAVSDEDGYVSFFNTRKSFPASASPQENAEKVRISDWIAHQNAIFDLCWIKEDTKILTASGDQTIKVWDAQEKKCVTTLMGHTGSVKSLHCHPTDSDIVASGSRDGSFALWDLRCRSSSRSSHWGSFLSSTAMVKGAHLSAKAKRVKRKKAASMSITSVLYLRDEVSIATAGAVDSVVKFWDTRNLKAPVTHASPQPEPLIEKEQKMHGVSSLSQDMRGLFLSASCMDNRIYLYNVLQLDKGPVKSFSGSRIESFYVKSALSPDATHILSGSSDGNAYVWQVNKPELDPVTLRSHHGEVTAVDWSSSDATRISTCSDDFTVSIWKMENNCYSSKGSPSYTRRRVMAVSSMERRKLFMDEASEPKGEGSVCTPAPDEAKGNMDTSCNTPLRMPKITTPESQKNCFLSTSDLKARLEKTPEAASRSPSSVLNPPSSLKRTIRDYFICASTKELSVNSSGFVTDGQNPHI